MGRRKRRRSANRTPESYLWRDPERRARQLPNLGQHPGAVRLRYVDPDRHWSLIKLHGSMDWARRSMVATPDHPAIRSSWASPRR
jgi:hypothetical protein